ncbi:outer membrane protein assembly factor BamA [Marinomonas sp. C2222]|uniref:Outer membrane protein assembly factor BamA n=1 Tax=Marinomonas sargassi TaxID=2984494 RepID=A0ABT2YV83_9GAMM|nr:outer membrane protein assembly factor BamA [Marinomonas sargassi]MCV2403807.1 outer membrane protein assembly factor BamA [Marinomonas sargassi]
MKFFSAVFLALISVHGVAKPVEDVRIDGLIQMPSTRAFDLIGFDDDKTYDSNKVYEAINSLFNSGFFSDIDVYDDQGVLVFDVVERASIGDLTISGNELVNTEDLERGLKLSGLEIGEIYKPETLNQISQELQRQYFALGRYSAKVDIKVDDMPRNRVGISIDIDEGDTAKIVHINIVGNTAFDDETLTEDFEARETGYWNPFSSADEYAKAKIDGDINTLRSFYLDQGYLDFKVVSSQVSLSSDKRDVYVVINIEEGKPYSLNDLSLSGSLPISEDLVWQHISHAQGDTFSRQEVTDIIEKISTELGNHGYLFASVNVIPEKLDDQTVNLSYQINPGSRVYVRRITFAGNSETQDEVLRREMTQFEGALAVHSKIQASKRRLERLGFFGNVNLRTRPVPGTTDLVDLEFTVLEQPSGSIQASIGFSDDDGLIYGFGISKSNFLGTGNRLSFNASKSDEYTSYSLSYRNPYFTVDGVSRGARFYYQSSDYDSDDIEDYQLDKIGAELSYGYPISDTQSLTFSLGVQETSIDLSDDPSNESEYFVDTYGDNYDDIIASITWRDNDLIGGILPTNGYSTNLNLRVTTPGSDQEYYKASLTSEKYWNIDNSNLWLFHAKGRVSYGNGYGDSEYLPFYENYYAGGAGTVRGYSSSSLGPQNSYDDDSDSNSDAMGGNFLMAGTLEVIFPLPMVEDHKSVRTAAFLDAGNVFATSCFPVSTNCTSGVDLGEIRYSVGLSWTWITPIAPLSFNVAKAINPEDDDETDFFQFRLGTAF